MAALDVNSNAAVMVRDFFIDISSVIEAGIVDACSTCIRGGWSANAADGSAGDPASRQPGEGLASSYSAVTRVAEMLPLISFTSWPFTS
jgi:hypothetical protein